MNFDDLIQSMTPEIHASMKRAVELGKWPGGRHLSDEEKSACLQAVIAYDARHLPEEERVGHIERKHSDASSPGASNPSAVNISCQSSSDVVKIIAK